MDNTNGKTGTGDKLDNKLKTGFNGSVNVETSIFALKKIFFICFKIIAIADSAVYCNTAFLIYKNFKQSRCYLLGTL